MNPIHRLGVLGLGEGRSILSAATRSPRWEVAGLCDLDTDLCREREREFGLAGSTTCYAEMLANPAIEVVAIYTPDAWHADHVLQALAAGKHVICTKPLFTTLERAREVIDAVRRTGRQVLVGHSCRFFPTFQLQQAAVRAGRLGELISVEAHYNGDKRRGTSGRWGKHGAANWLYTGLSHAVDLVHWNLGPIAEVFACATHSPAGRALGQAREDCFHATLRSERGTLGLASGIFGAPVAPVGALPEMGCTVRGAKGVACACYPSFDYWENVDGAGEVHRSFAEHYSYYFPFGGHSHHAGEFQNYLEHFGECLDRGQAPQPGIDEGVQVVATLVAIERSIATRQPVRVGDVLAHYGLSVAPPP